MAEGEAGLADMGGGEVAGAECGEVGGEGVVECEKIALLQRLRQLYEYEPRQEQVEAIHILVYRRRDLILSARTGWGKSMIFQSVPVLRNGGICLMIMPLNALEEDQARSIDQLPGCRSCVLNGESNSSALRQHIRNGEFTHILTSPEIALGKSFLAVLQDSEFQDRLALVAIDELHVVAQWGTVWRKEYSQLRELRSRVRRDIPWFGTSATLDPVMLETVKKLAGFDSPEEIHTPLDRPEIFINVQCLRFPASSHKDLRFLISSTSPIGILPKTIVYVERISELVKVVRRLRKWLVKAGHSKEQSVVLVRAYHAELAEQDKRLTATEFSKSDSVYRIIVATDAMGMGVNNPDVLRVVQWKKPESMCSLMQRAGRAARKSGIYGEFIWLVEPWCYGSRLEDLHGTKAKCSRLSSQFSQSQLEGEIASRTGNNSASGSETVRKSRKDPAERRSNLPPGLWKVINDRNNCIRRNILAFFDTAPPGEADTYPNGCCSNCHPERNLIPKFSGSTTSPRVGRLNESNWTPGYRQKAVEKAISEWRDRIVPVLFASTVVSRMEGGGQFFLDDKTIREWSRVAAGIRSIDDFRSIAKGWSWAKAHERELTRLIRDTVRSTVNPRQVQLSPTKRGKNRIRRPLSAIHSNIQAPAPIAGAHK